MRKFLISSGTVLLAVALLLAGSPANAGSKSWEDDVDEPETAAQATLDITKVTLDFDGKTFTSTIDIKQLGDPAPAGSGQFFGLDFVFGGKDYILTVNQDRLVGDYFVFQSAETSPDGNTRTVTTIPCKTCKFELDFEGSKVRMQIGWESLTSAARKLAPGGKITDLEASSGPTYAEPSQMIFTSPIILWGTTPGDTATAPGDASFTF